MTKELADKLEVLMVAETETQFYNCLTDNIDTILSALRAPKANKVKERTIITCANIANRYRPNSLARDIEREIRTMLKANEL